MPRCIGTVRARNQSINQSTNQRNIGWSGDKQNDARSNAIKTGGLPCRFIAADPQIVVAGYFTTIYNLQLGAVLFRFHCMNISLTANVLTMRKALQVIKIRYITTYFSLQINILSATAIRRCADCYLYCI